MQQHAAQTASSYCNAAYEAARPRACVLRPTAHLGHGQDVRHSLGCDGNEGMADAGAGGHVARHRQGQQAANLRRVGGPARAERWEPGRFGAASTARCACAGQSSNVVGTPPYPRESCVQLFIRCRRAQAVDHQHRGRSSVHRPRTPPGLHCLGPAVHERDPGRYALVVSCSPVGWSPKGSAGRVRGGLCCVARACFTRPPFAHDAWGWVSACNASDAFSAVAVYGLQQ